MIYDPSDIRRVVNRIVASRVLRDLALPVSCGTLPAFAEAVSQPVGGPYGSIAGAF